MLTKQLDCRVNNFGVGGYGTDQAFLRFRRNKDDQSGIVILGVASENIVRNVNRFPMGFDFLSRAHSEL